MRTILVVYPPTGSKATNREKSTRLHSWHSLHFFTLYTSNALPVRLSPNQQYQSPKELQLVVKNLVSNVAKYNNAIMLLLLLELILSVLDKLHIFYRVGKVPKMSPSIIFGNCWRMISAHYISSWHPLKHSKREQEHSMWMHPFCGALSQGGLNPIKLAYDLHRLDG